MIERIVPVGQRNHRFSSISIKAKVHRFTKFIRRHSANWFKFILLLIAVFIPLYLIQDLFHPNPRHENHHFNKQGNPGQFYQVDMLIEQIPSELDDEPLFNIMNEPSLRGDSVKQLSSKDAKAFGYKLEDTLAIYISYLKVCLENGNFNPVLPFSWSDWYQLNYNYELGDIQDVTNNFNFEVAESQEIKAKRGLEYIQSLNYSIERLIFMDSESTRNFVVRVDNDSSGKSSVRDSVSGLLVYLQSKGIYSTPINYQSDLRLISRIQQNNERFLELPKFETRSNMDYDSFDGDEMFINLHEFDFDFNLTQRTEELRNFVSDRNSNELVKLYYNNIHFVEMLAETGNFEKFFHEVELTEDPSLAGSHYDWRFFKHVLQEKQKYFVLHHLIRTWQEFASKEKLIYWLSHGNLLSWRWSGSSFIWDHDCDIQLPIKHLEFLAINFNGSLIIEDPKYGFNRYLIEVNPYFADRLNVDGKNSIDGRIIDLASGLYIDLTGMSTIDDDTGIISDKHIHRYSLQSLSPLRATLYEGKQTWVPHDVHYILTQEYPTGLFDTQYHDYQYLPNFKGWFKNPDDCLEKSLLSVRAFHIPSVDSRDHCIDFTFAQLNHLMKFWNLKAIEEELLCFNKIHCKLPLDQEGLNSIENSTYIEASSNIQKWDLDDFAAEGLRKLVNSFTLGPIPSTDMTVNCFQ